MTKTPTITIMATVDALALGRAIQAAAHIAIQELAARRPSVHNGVHDAKALDRVMEAFKAAGSIPTEDLVSLTVGAPFPTPHMDSFLRDAACAKQTCGMKGCPGHDSRTAPAMTDAEDALDRIAALCDCPDWGYPAQVVRDVEGLKQAAGNWQTAAGIQTARADKAEALVKELEAQLADAAKAERERIIKAVSDGISTAGFDHLATLIRVDHAAMKIMVNKTLLQSTLEPKP